MRRSMLYCTLKYHALFPRSSSNGLERCIYYERLANMPTVARHVRLRCLTSHRWKTLTLLPPAGRAGFGGGRPAKPASHGPGT